MRTRSYSELSRIETFEDRFEYLSLAGQVGKLLSALIAGSTSNSIVHMNGAKFVTLSSCETTDATLAFLGMRFILS
jgi:hypothetical protein